MYKATVYFSFIFSFILLIAASISTTKVQAQAEANIILAGDYNTDHIENLKLLVEQMDQKGYNFKPLVEDSRFELYDGITERFTRSAERRTPTLEEYKQILGFDVKMRNIRTFIDDNGDQLSKAETEYGIPRYVIAAIIGIESDFGRNVGSYNPLNAYVSMIIEDYRTDFAQAQLEELLKFTEKHDLDVFELKSSYAGAMTSAQFIPYSLNRWWVGSDLFDMNNNILSVANYLAHFKKITGSVEKAVYRYNPSQLYTDAVLSLAAEAEKLYN